MKALLAVAVIAVAAMIGIGCGDDDGVVPTTTAAEAPGDGGEANPPDKPSPGEKGGGSKKPADREPPGIKLTTAGSQFGEVLFDGDKRAIYYFDKERSEQSECYGACAEAWPPVLTKGAPTAAGGAKQGLLGTTERDGGATQVTYDGRPLYYYVDEPPGQVLCHNVDEFGGLWLAVTPQGPAVQ